ncbi:hypothetical protein MC885_008334 [Smutsia gigantea]|nr:hypothetical protein MC885_008334 [Smutsia gigantea]
MGQVWSVFSALPKESRIPGLGLRDRHVGSQGRSRHGPPERGLGKAELAVDDGVDTQSGTKKEDLNDKEKDEEETTAPATMNELKECLSVFVKEQKVLAIQSATTTLSALRLQQRLVILEWYFIALSRAVFQENFKVKWKSSSISLPPVDKKSSRPTGKGVEGLASVGS